jgi:glycosyltransferase involved in cell wall biosynthesis
MKHDFVIPAYGTPLHLDRCIESILAQEGEASRILIGTSTPSDALNEIAARYRLAVVRNPERADIATDWNFVMALSDAEFLTIAHQDDTYAPGYLAAMRQAARACPDMTVAFSDYVEHTELGDRPLNLNLRVKRRLCRHAFGDAAAITSTAAKRRLLRYGNPVCCPSVMFNRRRAPDFSFSRRYRTNLDWDAWLRLADMPGAFVYVRESLVSKLVHPGSETSVTIANQTRPREDRLMFERLWPKPVAALIAAGYALGYRSNRV